MTNDLFIVSTKAGDELCQLKYYMYVKQVESKAD